MLRGIDGYSPCRSARPAQKLLPTIQFTRNSVNFVAGFCFLGRNPVPLARTGLAMRAHRLLLYYLHQLEFVR